MPVAAHGGEGEGIAGITSPADRNSVGHGRLDY